MSAVCAERWHTPAKALRRITAAWRNLFMCLCLSRPLLCRKGQLRAAGLARVQRIVVTGYIQRRINAIGDPESIGGRRRQSRSCDRDGLLVRRKLEIQRDARNLVVRRVPQRNTVPLSEARRVDLMIERQRESGSIQHARNGGMD